MKISIKFLFLTFSLIFLGLSNVFASPTPAITSFIPSSGAAGSSVTITGTAFSATPSNNVVFIGSVKATVTASTATTITFTVPETAPSDIITVVTGGKQCKSKLTFTTVASNSRTIATTMFGTGAAALSTTAGTGITNQGGDIAYADFDGDGKVDVVSFPNGSSAVANANVINIFRNTSVGSGYTFTLSTLVAGSTTAWFRNFGKIVDIDNDGDLDIMVCATNPNGGGSDYNQILLFTNNSTSGNVSFSKTTIINNASLSRFARIDVADMNNDGYMDFVTAKDNGSVGVYINNTSGSFVLSASVVASYATANVQSVLIADINEDGLNDILFSYDYNDGSWKAKLDYSLNTSGGSFSMGAVVNIENITVASERYVSDIKFCDLNADGLGDILFYSSQTVYGWKNTNSTSGVLSFAARQTLLTDANIQNSFFGSITLYDADADGKPDLFASGAYYFGAKNTSTNGGAISFDANIKTPIMGSHYSGTTLDINGDGYIELVFINESNSALEIYNLVVPTIWNGVTSTDWGTNTNWTSNIVPTSSVDVVIPSAPANQPIITALANCKNITINSGATLTINTNRLSINSENGTTGTLTNNGTLTLSSSTTMQLYRLTNTGTVTINPNASLTILAAVAVGSFVNNGTLTIKSTVAGTGSLLINTSPAVSTYSGSGTCAVERYIVGSQWHFVSSPVSSSQSGVFTGLYLKPYNEPTNDFGAYIAPTTNALTVGTGYALWAGSTTTASFTGALNNGTIGPITLTKSAGGTASTRGWNLVGNPYPSAVSLAGLYSDAVGLGTSVYTWNPTSGNYQYWRWDQSWGTGSANNFVAVGQGFIVQVANVGTGTITFKNSRRAHNTVPFFKSTTNSVDNAIRIMVTNDANSFNDEAVVVMNDIATTDYDCSFDATKLQGDAAAPMLYTMKDGDKMCVSNFASLNDINHKEVNLKVGTDGTHILSFSHTLLSGNVVLLDKKTNSIINNGDVYQFSGLTSDAENRFELVFSTTNLASLEKSNLKIVASDNIVYIKSDLSKSVTVQILSVEGKKLVETNNSTIDLNGFAKGIYIVKASTSNENIIKKIIVN